MVFLLDIYCIYQEKNELLHLNQSEHEYLILHTVSCHTEEALINDILKIKDEINLYNNYLWKHVLDETTKTTIE